MPSPGEEQPQPAREQPAGTSLTLLQRARANEGDAWSRMVALYAPLVRHWCAAAGAAPGDIDDLAQEVFLSASRALERFHRDRPGDTFRGWLRAIARNAVIDHLRRSGREPAGVGGSEARLLLQNVEGPTAEGESDEDPPAEIEGLYRRALAMVRCEFEERTWQMFWQTVVEDQPTEAVAEQFAVSTAAVRKARSRVLRRLKEEVGDVIE